MDADLREVQAKSGAYGKQFSSLARRVSAIGVASICIIALFLYVLTSNQVAFGFGRPWPEVPGLLVLACSLMVAAGAIALARVIDRRSSWFESHYLGVVAGLTLTVMTLQTLLVLAVWGVPGWDSGMMLQTATALSLGQNPPFLDGYFSTYPNNAFLTWLFSGLFALGSQAGIDGILLCALVGACCVSLSGALVCLALRKLGMSPGGVLAAWALYTLLFSLSPWVGIPYSDTYATLPIALMVWLVATWNFRGIMNVGLVSALLGVFAFVGYLVKPTVLLVALPLGTLWLVRVFREAKPSRMYGLGAVVMGVAFSLVLAGCLGLVSKAAVGVPADNDQALGIAHFLMMGQGEATTGAWNAEDVVLSKSFESDERSAREMDEALERIGARGFLGNLAFYAKKTLFSFADGSFSWAVDGGDGFYSEVREPCLPCASAVRDVVYKEVWQEGASIQRFRLYSQVLWCAALLLIATGSLRALRLRWNAGSKVMMACGMAVLLLFVYLMLFEDRARYLYCFGPVFAVLVARGVSGLQSRAVLPILPRCASQHVN